MDSIKPRVLATGRYAIDVEPIPPHNRNNKEVHLDYLKHLKENVETLHEIVEEAKVERPLDSSLAFACLYTKHSQELLEYVIDTCPNAANPLTRKKQVTFEDQCETSNSNTHKRIEQLNIQKTNVPVPPSTGLSKLMAPVQLSTGLVPTFLTPGQISSGLVPNPNQFSPTPAVPVPVNSTGTPSSTTIDQDAPSPSHLPSSLALQSPSLHQGVVAGSTIIEDNPFAHVDNNVFASKPSSKAPHLGMLVQRITSWSAQPQHHLGKSSKEHPLDNVIWQSSRPYPPENTYKLMLVLLSTVMFSEKQGSLVAKDIDKRSKNMTIYQMDVKTAFLNAVEEEVNVLFNQQAPRAWYDTLSQFLLDNKFSKGAVERRLIHSENRANIFFLFK
ncbi:hypothetical protein Tco_0876952 [Tanacetum coccineum]|uniref:Reverse transcriptase Ty1/copia-type domain-containing protein n=1 Tax=Tanacetum coccineum TaxID=301880 RepID=A0ABQ5BTR5_9ASTR